MNTKKQAKKHFENLANNWWQDELKYYLENFDTDSREALENIPTSELEECNYKDLRILEDYFKEEFTHLGMNKLEEAIEEAKNYFTNEEESEIMNQNDSDLNFDVGFYKGLLEAQLIQSNSNNQNNYEKDDYLLILPNENIQAIAGSIECIKEFAEELNQKKYVIAKVVEVSQ